ncbi:MAG: alpha/beta hydrolase [Flavobacteriaceae bacterium]
MNRAYSLLMVILFILVSCQEKSHYSEPLTYLGELSSGTIDSYVDFPSKYVRARNVDVWLPQNYHPSESYQVLYMHDGQMLFDAKTTWNKQEWEVDEHLGELLSNNEVPPTIVVAVWNHADIRWNEYFPIKAGQQGLNQINNQTDYKQFIDGPHYADDYLKFLVEELKPFIDHKYAVKSDMEHTFIAGSSMGGLISMYAICEYPEVFSAAACLSTHWIGVHNLKEANPVPESFLTYFKANFPVDGKHKIYFDFGTETLDAEYLIYQPMVDTIIKEMKIKAINKGFEGHDHSENSWNLRLDEPLKFILNDE